MFAYYLNIYENIDLLGRHFYFDSIIICQSVGTVFLIELIIYLLSLLMVSMSKINRR
jgi:hypothetical protein